MKKSIFVLGMIMILSQACSKSNEAPEPVKEAFNQKFPNAKNVKWDKENETEWEAEFKMNGEEYSANFSSDGTWKETESDIAESEIPAAVKLTLNTEFEGYKIEEVEISETIDGKFYEFALENEDMNMEVVISAEGKVFTTDVIPEEDLEND
jgi:hypothetical protein